MSQLSTSFPKSEEACACIRPEGGSISIYDWLDQLQIKLPLHVQSCTSTDANRKTSFVAFPRWQGLEIMFL